MEQLTMFGAQTEKHEMVPLVIQPGHHIYQAGTRIVGRYLPELQWWRCYSLKGEPLGDLHPMYVKEVQS